MTEYTMTAPDGKSGPTPEALAHRERMLASLTGASASGLHVVFERADKKPAHDGWPWLAPPTPAQVEAHLRANPTHRGAIRIGAGAHPSGDSLIHVEADGDDDDPAKPGRRDAAESMARFLGGYAARASDLPAILAGTLSWWSPRGGHALYRVPAAIADDLAEDLKSGALGGYPGLEVRLPGRHPDGRPIGRKATIPPSPSRGLERVWACRWWEVRPLPDRALALLQDIVAAKRAARERAAAAWAAAAPERAAAAAAARAASALLDGDEDDDWARYRLAATRAYVRAMDPAVSGCGGHDAAFSAACRVVERGFDEVDQVVEILELEFNHRCAPPWTPADLRHKAEDALRAAKTKPEVIALLRERYEASKAEAAAAKKKSRPRPAPRPLAPAGPDVVAVPAASASSAARLVTI